jgi:hypothetical protein
LRKADSQATLYAVFNDIEEAIDKSRWILNHGEEIFDDFKSPRYSADTWQRATEFLRRHIQWAREVKGIEIEIPHILPGPSGNIDLHWKTAKYELLLSFPADAESKAAFYGDDYGNGVVKWRLDQSDYSFEPLTYLAKK